MGSSALDRDRWCLGNEAEMHAWIAAEWGGVEPLTHEQQHEILWREAALQNWNLKP